MSLALHFHPLSSFCWKVLIALYENETPFETHHVNFGDAASRAAFYALWPIGKMPVLRDEARDKTVPESTIIIEYLDLHYPGRTTFVPKDPDLAWQTRLADRFYDLHVHHPMQAVVADRLRPGDKKDPLGVEQAKGKLKLAYGIIEKEMGSRSWASGETFTLADCAAAPALFYANKVVPFEAEHRNVSAYLDRLLQRPSVARVIGEAEPYFKMFPAEG